MPPRRNTNTSVEEKTIDNGRYNTVKKMWECTAVNVNCSCKRCKNKVSEVCAHAYRNKGELRAHHKGHHGAGTGLICRYGCGHAAFQNQSNLRRHEHTCKSAPEGPKLQCPQCQAQHARSDNFKRHLMTTHEFTAEDARALVQQLRGRGPQAGNSASPQLQSPVVVELDSEDETRPEDRMTYMGYASYVDVDPSTFIQPYIERQTPWQDDQYNVRPQRGNVYAGMDDETFLAAGYDNGVYQPLPQWYPSQEPMFSQGMSV